MASAEPVAGSDNPPAVSKYRIFNPPEVTNAGPAHECKQPRGTPRHPRSEQADGCGSEVHGDRTWHPLRSTVTAGPAADQCRPFAAAVASSARPTSSSESRMDNLRFSAIHCAAGAANAERACRRRQDGGKGAKKRRSSSPELWGGEALCGWTTPPSSAHGVGTKDLFALLHARRVRAPMDYTRPSSPAPDAAGTVRDVRAAPAPTRKTGRTAAVAAPNPADQPDTSPSGAGAARPADPAVTETESRSAPQSASQNPYTELLCPPLEARRQIPDHPSPAPPVPSVPPVQRQFAGEAAAGRVRSASARPIAKPRIWGPFAARQRKLTIIECGNDLAMTVRRDDSEEEKIKEAKAFKEQKRAERYAMRELRKIFPPLLPRGGRESAVTNNNLPRANNLKMGIKGEPPPRAAAFRNPASQALIGGQGGPVHSDKANGDNFDDADRNSEGTRQPTDLDFSCVNYVAQLNRQLFARIGNEREATSERPVPPTHALFRHELAFTKPPREDPADTTFFATASTPDLSAPPAWSSRTRSNSDPTTKLPRLIVGTGLLQQTPPERQPRPRPDRASQPGAANSAHVPTGGMVFGEAAIIAERAKRGRDPAAGVARAGRYCVLGPKAKMPEWMGGLALSLSTSLSLMRG